MWYRIRIKITQCNKEFRYWKNHICDVGVMYKEGQPAKIYRIILDTFLMYMFDLKLAKLQIIANNQPPL